MTISEAEVRRIVHEVIAELTAQNPGMFVRKELCDERAAGIRQEIQGLRDGFYWLRWLVGGACLAGAGNLIAILAK